MKLVNVLEAYPSSWSMDKFLSLKNATERHAYAGAHLKKIGQGSSRIVYQIDDDKILKIARQAGDYNKGTAQNELEVDINNLYPHVTTKVFDYDEEHYRWVEHELVTPIKSKKTFEQKTGIAFDEFTDWLEDRCLTNSGKRRNYKITSNELDDDEFAKEILDLIVNYDAVKYYLDYIRLEHYGVTKDGSVVLLDYGINSSVFREFYLKK